MTRRKRIWLVLATISAMVLLALILYSAARGVKLPSFVAAPGHPAAVSRLSYKYLPDQALELELYPPTRTVFRKSPVLVYIHGGSWRRGSHRLKNSDLEKIFNPIRSLGITVVSVQYRLTDDQTRFPDHLEDVTDALRFIVQNAATYGLDENRIGVLGVSAGAHLALLAAVADDLLARDPVLAGVGYRVRCIVAIAVPVDLVDLSDYSETERRQIEILLAEFMGSTYTQNPDIYTQGSPITYISADWPPLFLVHGEEDQLVSIAQVDRFHQAAQAVGMKITYIRVQNGSHDLSPIQGTEATPDITAVVRKMLLFLLRNLLL